MAIPEILQSLLASLQNVTRTQWVSVLGGAFSAYTVGQWIYRLYFHPASRFPGPRLAAISHAWYAYAWLTGRWPWKVEEVLKKYGDVVRVAPNEIVFISAKASEDIHVPQVKGLETWVKTNMMDFGQGDLGIVWETNPAKHHAEAKKLAPAFSNRAMKGKEAALQKHIDLFVQRMHEHGAAPEGIDFGTWSLWLCLDISADMTYNRQMNQMRDMKNSPFLDIMLGVNLMGTINQIMKKIKWPIFLMFLVTPPSLLRLLPRAIKKNKAEFARRVQARGNTEHPDYFEQLLPANEPIPTDKGVLRHLEQSTGQMLIAGYDPLSNLIYAAVFWLVKAPDVQKILAKEIRDTFARYDDINPDALASLKYMHAFIQETLRCFSQSQAGRPRVSPGGMVDGIYIEKGIVCQTSTFARYRSSRFYRDPLSCRPQRFLPRDHPLYDEKYANDDIEGFNPFGRGPRSCSGMPVAYSHTRLFLAKTLWSFDLHMVPGQDVSFERDFKVYTMWEKPKIMVQFVPVARE